MWLPQSGAAERLEARVTWLKLSLLFVQSMLSSSPFLFSTMPSASSSPPPYAFSSSRPSLAIPSMFVPTKFSNNFSSLLPRRRQRCLTGPYHLSKEDEDQSQQMEPAQRGSQKPQHNLRPNLERPETRNSSQRIHHEPKLRKQLHQQPQLHHQHRYQQNLHDTKHQDQTFKQNQQNQHKNNRPSNRQKQQFRHDLPQKYSQDPRQNPQQYSMPINSHAQKQNENPAMQKKDRNRVHPSQQEFSRHQQQQQNDYSRFQTPQQNLLDSQQRMQQPMQQRHQQLQQSISQSKFPPNQPMQIPKHQPQQFPQQPSIQQHEQNLHPQQSHAIWNGDEDFDNDYGYGMYDHESTRKVSNGDFIGDAEIYNGESTFNRENYARLNVGGQSIGDRNGRIGTMPPEKAATNDSSNPPESFPVPNSSSNPVTQNEPIPSSPNQKSSSSQRRIPPEVIEQIKSSVNIVDVIESYNLPHFSRSSEGAAKACCPFHDDTNPSLSIISNLRSHGISGGGKGGMYKCFSCGAGGDVFHFVREYDALNRDGNKFNKGGKGSDKMSYLKAVELVAKEFGDASLLDGWDFLSWNDNDGSDGGNSRMSKEKREKLREIERKKDRIREANTAAAAFFTQCLITLPTAGKARAHLRSRGISPASIGNFALGYAPDAYYGDESLTPPSKTSVNNSNLEKSKSSSKVKKPSKRSWGEGSLVEYLASLEFTPSEIVEAGLAVRTKYVGGEERGKGALKKASIKTLAANNETLDDDDQKSENSNENDTEESDYSALMDRFRSRLIVPILDEAGQHVIAFGGRHLPGSERTGSSDEGRGADEDGSNEKINNSKNAEDSKVVKDIIRTTKTKAEKATFTPPKYINSPDSLVFTKKNILFNSHKARVAVENRGNQTNPTTRDSTVQSTQPPVSLLAAFKSPPTLIIVEGYFDAIALSNVGIENVVASMGTALPLEQLKKAAEIVDASNVPGGQIIICMDNDDAGRNALERLCTSNLLAKASEMTKVEITVASMPNGGTDGKIQVKDPSDFVEYAGGGTTAKERFQEEVLDTVQSWDEWYIDFILSKYNPSVKDGIDSRDQTGLSFSDICEQVSTFLATFSNPADRTRRAYSVSEKLASLLASERGDLDQDASSSLGMIRVQLESDILSMSSRKAGIREAMERRIEQTDGFTGDVIMAKMDKLSSGNSVDTNDDDQKMSKSGLIMAKQNANGINKLNIRQRGNQNMDPMGSRNRSIRGNSRKKWRTPSSSESHLVPHFHGFNFPHQSDRDWLGISSDKKKSAKMYLGSPSVDRDDSDRLETEIPLFDEGKARRKKKQDIIYFNSNRYLGERYLTPEAMQMGYSLGNDRPSAAESIVEFTTKKLLEQDADGLILQAESRLLHALAKFPQARAAMRNVYSASTFGPKNMQWTCKEREWLFLCLTGSEEISPSVPVELLDGGTPDQLHKHLSHRGDCPENSFGRDVYTDSIPSKTHLDDAIDTADNDGTVPSDLVDGTSFDMESSGDEQILASNETIVDDSFDHIYEDNRMGLLDEFFLESEDMFPSFSKNAIAQETRAELTVQETVAILLRATAMKRFSSTKSYLSRIVDEIEHREKGAANEHEHFKPNYGDFDDLSLEDLHGMFEKVGLDVINAQKDLYEADRSYDRVNKHLLDYSVSNGVHFKTSQAQVERLHKMMEEHIASLPEDHHRPETPGDDGTYVFGSDEYDDSIDPMFGGRNPSEYRTRGLPNGDITWA